MELLGRQTGIAHYVGLALIACLSGCAEPPKTPGPAGPQFASRFAEAERIEQSGSSADAMEAYLGVLDAASRSPGATGALSAAAASLDALVLRRIAPLAELSAPHAVAFRVPGGTAHVLARLEPIWQGASPGGGILRPMLATAALRLAMYDGLPEAARTWRERSACLRSAAVFGPLTAHGLERLAAPLPFEKPGVPMPSRLERGNPGDPPALLHTVEADGCDLPLLTTTSRQGMRTVVADLQLDRPQRVWVSVTSTSAAVASLGGRPVVVRGFEAGAGAVTGVGGTNLPAGVARLVVRVAVREDGSAVAIRVLDDDGNPVRSTPARAGERAPAVGEGQARIAIQPEGKDEASLAMQANALLALGEVRKAGAVVEDAVRRPDASAMLLLAQTRALGEDSVLPDNRRIERMRDAYDRATARLPESWEATIGKAWLDGLRKGQSEARLQSIVVLREADATAGRVHPMSRVFESVMASRARVPDVAQEARDAANEGLGEAPVVRVLDGIVTDRAPADRARFRCSTKGLDASSLDCYTALVESGQMPPAMEELARLRVLRGSNRALLALEASASVQLRDAQNALRLYDAQDAGQRVFAPLGLLAESRATDVLARLERDIPAAPHDLSNALDLWLALNGERYRAFDAVGKAAVDADRKRPVMPDAALLVLEHTERYDVTERGVVRYTIHDVRRVSGTTDVEVSAQASGPTVEGIETERVLRRRIHKRDGRVLEPEEAEQAEQGDSDLSQLQPGDYVEQLLVGLAVPGPSGRFVVDTPDLMPERASVHHAEIAIHRPGSMALERWGHPMFSPLSGARGEDGSEVWKVELVDKPARRLESGIPRMDRHVRVTFGNSSWTAIGQALGEAAAAMRSEDSAVRAFALQAAGDARAPTRQLLRRIVAAVGAKVPVSSGSALSDLGAAMSAGPQRATARTILENAQGSRTWLAHEMLRALGVASNIVVAEEEPFSAESAFPAHAGRFPHPLLVVHLPPGKDGGDVWMDLDVPGPPLPPGRITPELQGRTALRSTGEMLTVPVLDVDVVGDEIDVRLAVDDRGNARGTLTLMLRGRAAQILAESFQSTVGAERRELLRGVVLAWLPRADVDTVELSSGEGSWEVAVRATIGVPGFAQPEGKTLLLPGIIPLHQVAPEPESSTLTSEFAREGERESALAVDTAIRYRLHRRIELPAGWAFVSTPADATVDDERVRAGRVTRVDGTVLQEDFRLDVSTGTIAQDRFEEFTQAARRIDDAFLSSVRVSRNTQP